jgi:hypothetical protein
MFLKLTEQHWLSYKIFIFKRISHMKLELHHFFILVQSGGTVANLLSSAGMNEGSGNTHKGQGTSNRRFNFQNGTLELLWVHDTEEAINGSGKNLLLAQRAKEKHTSPFGIILTRKDTTHLDMPFNGWTYQPDYFEPPHAFHIGNNSSNLLEPLCIYMPFIEPLNLTTYQTDTSFSFISNVHIYTTSTALSDTLQITSTADRLTTSQAEEHLMVIDFDNNRCGLSKDLRPEIPLIVNW